ncbi:hypothetical protein HY29_02480 [Hyphomonas beringensis]|uniref:Aminopeptidase n=2 Tax=Hyphomonas beringensis TaxID=1280946 RepID=A0A062U9Y1_9PROT|nr:hypothetical protein HY29_02480 [Hyphomonas beringensis]
MISGHFLERFMRTFFLSFLVLGLGSLLAACGSHSQWGVTTSPASLEELQAVAPKGQLAGNAQPQLYRVALDLDPREQRFSGKVSIEIKLETAATGIWMHGDDLNVTKVTVTSGGESQPATWNEVLSTGVVRVGFPRRLKPGYLTMDIEYDAAFDANLAGLFRVDEKGEAYALAKSESIQARRFLPSFDEPGFKAPFDMQFTVPAGMVAIANTPEVSRENVGAGKELITFARTRPLSTYLLSVAVGNFDKVDAGMLPPNSVRAKAIPLTGYARKGKGAELDYILKMTPDLVQTFEESLQQPYPYEKLDIVAAPQWPSGATELAAAITYRESRILANENSGPAFLRSLKSIHAHETAHMWFGDLVTPPWWNGLWLKEGFATWGEAMALSQMEPDEGHEVQAVADAIGAMRLDSLASVRAIQEPILRNEDIRNAYDSITYNKSLGVINMADSYFLPDVFRPALGEYIARFADGVADSDDFFRVIGKDVGSPDLTEAFDSFVLQQGVPVVSADLQCTSQDAKVALSQTRYRPLGSSIEPGTRWTIPVCIAWQDGDEHGRTCTMLKTREKTLALSMPEGACPDVVHPNAGGVGYYRFTLGADEWDALRGSFAAMPETEVLSALDSAIAAFEAGNLEAARLLDILDAGAEQSGNQAANLALDYYGDLLERVKGTPAEAAARARAQAVVAKIRSVLDAEGGDAEMSARLDRFAAIKLNDEEVRARLTASVETYLDTQTGLSSDEYFPALAVALADGGPDMLDRVLVAKDEIDDPVFAQAVVNALGTVKSPEESARVLDLIESAELGPRETYTLAIMQMANAETQDATWAWVQENMPAFLDSIPTQWRRRAPRLGQNFCDMARTGELIDLFAEYGDLAEGYERALAETEESITLCAALNEATQSDLEAAFEASGN